MSLQKDLTDLYVCCSDIEMQLPMWGTKISAEDTNAADVRNRLYRLRCELRYITQFVKTNNVEYIK